jgi:hypothetical protein
MINLAILPEMDETLGSAMQFGFKRIRSWRVPPNWSRGDWFEELAAVGTAAAWQAVCEFDPAPIRAGRLRREKRFSHHMIGGFGRVF